MDCLEQLRQDYRLFPHQQTYDLYAPDVLFVDPLNRFRGRDRYQKMIAFLDRHFSPMRLDLHNLQQQGDHIESRWTLHLSVPLPWQPRLVISGTSLLRLNKEGHIAEHIDTWDRSPWSLGGQLLPGRSVPPS